MTVRREDYQQMDMVLTDMDKQLLVSQAPDGKGMELVNWAEEIIVAYYMLQNLLDADGLFEVAEWSGIHGEPSFRLKPGASP